MTRQLIEAYPTEHWEVDDPENSLNISEFYMDTIQGEGIFMGNPAAFLRLQGCTLSCSYCDTREVWRDGNPYEFEDLIQLMDTYGLIEKFKRGQHLVITGGSPLKQQKQLVKFLRTLQAEEKIIPFIEIENECVLSPMPELLPFVGIWNNSPKLASSGIPFKKRYNTLAIGDVARLHNSFFKFVITGPEDWDEIQSAFIETRMIEPHQILLMPEGVTAAEIAERQEDVIELCIKHNVRFSTRQHIVVWGKRTGI